MTPRLTPDEARKLLGGYATGTLTSEEREALFAAALEDQSLFDELAEEDSLRELLEAPGVKTRLLAATSEKPATFWFGIPWLTHPRALSLGGLAAMAALTVAFLSQRPAMLPERPGVVSEAPLPARPETASAPKRIVQQPMDAGLPPPKAGKISGKRETPAAAPAPAPARDELDRQKAKDTNRPEAKATENEVRKTEAPAPPPRPVSAEPPVTRAAAPPSAPAAAQPPPPPPAPKLADSKEKQDAASTAAPRIDSPVRSGFQAGSAPVTQQRLTPSQQSQAPAPQPPAQQSQDVRKPQEASASKTAGAGPGAPAQGEQKPAGSVGALRARKAAPALSASGRGGLISLLTLRYRLERPQGADAPTELTVEASMGFVYVLRRTGSTWDTVASGSGPHTLADTGEYAVVASRTELANPATALSGVPTNRNIVSSTGDGFTLIQTPESSVAATLRVRAR